MGIFIGQRERLLRTEWPNATMLAEELYTMFGSQEPIGIDSPLEIQASGDTSPINITFGNKPPDQPWVTPPWGDGNTRDTPTGVGGTVNISFGGGPIFDPTAGQWVTPPGGGGAVVNPVPGGTGFVPPPWGPQPDTDSFKQPPAIQIDNGPPQIFTTPVVFANTAYVYNPTSAPFSWDGSTWPFDFPPPTTGELIPIHWITDDTGKIDEPFPIQNYGPPGDERVGPPKNSDKSLLPAPIGTQQVEGVGAIPAISEGLIDGQNMARLFADGYSNDQTGRAAPTFLNLKDGEEVPAGFKFLITKVEVDPLLHIFAYYAAVPVWMS